VAAIRALEDPAAFVAERLAKVWEQPEMSKATSSGVAGRTRLNLSVPFGAKWFNPAK
jgi:hypothetical protein